MVSAVVIVAMVVRWLDDDGRAPAPLGLARSAAVAPFAGSEEVRAAVDDRCVRLVLADTPALRTAGLRGADDLGPYAGWDEPWRLAANVHRVYRECEGAAWNDPFDMTETMRDVRTLKLRFS